MAVSNLLRVVLSGTGAGETFAWGFHIKCAAAITDEAQLTTILGHMDTNMNTGSAPTPWQALTGLICDDQQYTALSGYFYSSAPGAASFLAHKSVTKPGNGSQYGMLQQAAVVTLHTARTGGSYRGRFFLPYSQATFITGHVISSSNRDAVALAGVDVLAAALDAVRLESGLDGSRIHVYSPTKATSNQVTSYSVDNRLDVQRRRANKQPTARQNYGTVQPA